MKFLKEEAQQPLSANNVFFMIKRELFCMEPFREIWYRNILLCSSHPARLRLGEMSSRDHADQSSARDCEAAQTGRGARLLTTEDGEVQTKRTKKGV
nr:hypothetical protein Iba_chr08aCG0840 [Ipomoea batatas]